MPRRRARPSASTRRPPTPPRPFNAGFERATRRKVCRMSRPFHVAILTFQGFNELDSIIALALLNRVRHPDWRITLCCPDAQVTSMNGVVVQAQSRLSEAASADAVIVGSGMRTREVVESPALMSQLTLDPARQLIGAQCSGALVLARLGLLNGVPACTDLFSKPGGQAAGGGGVDQPIFSRGHGAPPGGWP